MENNITRLQSVVRPVDLISAAEAGVMAGKKKDTVRSWVRKGKITGYRLDPDNPTSTLMVSTAELRVYLATDATPTHPDNKGRPPTPSASVEEKDKEIALLKKDLESVNQKLVMTEQRLTDILTFHNKLGVSLEQNKASELRLIDAYKATISTLEAQLDKVNLHCDKLQAQHDALQAEYKNSIADNKRLFEYLARPWWKRMKADIPLLTG